MFKKKIIQIITPARLHFGFLEINNNHPNNSFGGIGLSIDTVSYTHLRAHET